MAQSCPMVYKFKLTVKDFKPKTWRHILVPGNYSFSDLHLAIQATMIKWNNSHLHHFHMKNPRTGRDELISVHKEMAFDEKFVNEMTCRISDYFLAPKATAIYEYDFCVNWMLDVELMDILPAKKGEKYPQCVAGRNAGPPEDISSWQDDEYEEIHANQAFSPKAVVFRGPEERRKQETLVEEHLSPPNVYQFKVTLLDFEPLTWRRIIVPPDFTFYDLHVAIQSTMRWEDTHLHEFEVTNPATGQSDVISFRDDDDYDDYFDGEREILCGKTCNIADYFLAPKDQAIYEYDFGREWRHLVELEQILPATKEGQYPQCVDGEKAGPPEDSEDDEYEKAVAEQEFDPKAVVFQDPTGRNKRFSIALSLMTP